MSGAAEPESADREQSPPARGSEEGEATPEAADALNEEAEGLADEDEDGAEGGLGESEGRGHGGRVVTKTVQARNSFSDSNIRVEGDFIIGDGARLAVPVADVTRSVKIARDTFVEPGYFPQLIEALTEPKVILLTGAACGKRTTAGVALERTNHDPILELPSDMAARGLVDGIKKVCKRSPDAGIVVESVDSKTLSTLTGFELHRLDKILSDGAAVVLTTRSLKGVPQDMDGVNALECESPSLTQVLERATGSSEARDAAIAALGLLSDRVLSPNDALTLLEHARAADQSPEQLAQAFDGQATDVALDQWLSTDRTAEHLASLAAAAALDGAPSVDVDLAAETLSDMFAPEGEETVEGVKTFGVADRGWPEGIFALTQTSVSTHFGYQEVEVVEACAPHNRARIVAYLWQRLGVDFRRPFAQWLRDLAGHQSSEIRLGAAVTAGVLFAVDPVIAERELIRPWALDKRFSRRLCAAIALGAPVAIGADPAGARALAKGWSNSPDLRLQHVAVLAYGGLLGAWDPGSAAATHLWRIATETPELARAARISLASLTAAGGSAARVRATVLGMLSAQAEIERAPRHVYVLLPLVLRHLTARGDTPRDSLMALLNAPQERESLRTLSKLIANAFSAPSGYESARATLEVLLQAMADGRIEQTAVFRIVAELRQAGREGSEIEVLDAQLERTLWANARKRAPTADAARSVLNEFFPSS